jgi:hypothetical protein
MTPVTTTAAVEQQQQQQQQQQQPPHQHQSVNRWFPSTNSNDARSVKSRISNLSCCIYQRQPFKLASSQPPTPLAGFKLYIEARKVASLFKSDQHSPRIQGMRISKHSSQTTTSTATTSDLGV